MTPEQEKFSDAVIDVSKHASMEAAKRICDIADIMNTKQEKLVIGLRASRSLYVSYLLTAISNGMPHEVADCFVADTIEQINEAIAALNEKRKEEAQ